MAARAQALVDGMLCSLHNTADIFASLKVASEDPDPAAAAAVGVPEGESCIIGAQGRQGCSGRVGR